MEEGRVGMGLTPSPSMDSSPAETFTASRWTQGNFLFPTRLVISPQRVSRVNRRLFGANEESIAMSKVASLHISPGAFLPEIRNESTIRPDPTTTPRQPNSHHQRL